MPSSATANSPGLLLPKLRPAAPMFIRGVGTATPKARYTKAECLQVFEQSDGFGRLDARAHFIARSVLQRDNGIDAPHLAG